MISYNISHVLCIRDESLHHNRWQKMVYFNTSFPKPLTGERLNFSLAARVTDESMRSCNNYSYAAQFNTSIPFLWVSLKFKKTNHTTWSIVMVAMVSYDGYYGYGCCLVTTHLFVI